MKKKVLVALMGVFIAGISGTAFSVMSEDQPVFEAFWKSEQEVKKLIEAGADVNEKSNLAGMTILMYAVSHGQTGKTSGLVQWLLERPDLKINAQSRDRQTALMYLFGGMWGRYDYESALPLARMLLVKGADYNAKDENGDTVLMQAAEFSAKKLVELFLQQKEINVNETNPAGRTALMFLTVPPPTGFLAADEETKKRGIEIAKMLVTHRADSNVQDNDGYTALMLAIINDYPELVLFLLQQPGIDVKAQGKDGKNAVFLALEKDNKEILEALVKAGADFNAQNAEGVTPLMYAVDEGKEEFINWLLTVPGVVIDLDIQSEEVGTALMYLFKGQSWVISDPQKALRIAKLLIDKDIDLNTPDSKGYTALMQAITMNATDIAKLILQQPEIDVKAKSYYDKNTALSLAAEKRNKGILKLLAEKGADIRKLKDPRLRDFLAPFVPPKAVAERLSTNQEAMLPEHKI